MATKTYHGSCRCGQIKYEVDLDLASAGTSKCNCTYCWKLRWWGTQATPSQFRLLAAPPDLGYGFPTDKFGTRAICKQCGIIAFGWGHLPAIGGDYVSISVSALDDLDPAELVSVPVRYMDGKHDNWFNEPAYTAHL